MISKGCVAVNVADLASEGAAPQDCRAFDAIEMLTIRAYIPAGPVLGHSPLTLTLASCVVLSEGIRGCARLAKAAIYLRGCVALLLLVALGA